MIWYVNANVKNDGEGTKEHPFRTISLAAKQVRPGDMVYVKPGIYREWVNPTVSGDAEKPISFISEVKNGAVITGAERICGWEQVEKDVWEVAVPKTFFGDYNPYTTILKGDWYYGGNAYHSGEVYLNGESMYETDSPEKVKAPGQMMYSWYPEKSVYQWYTYEKDEKTHIIANFHGKDPNHENVEINVRRNCFYPSQTGISYIRLSGFIIKQAATTWAPPTAYQEGMVGPHWSKGWVIEDCEISDSKCCGISLGKYLQAENDNKWTEKRLKHGTQTERDAICQAVNEGWSKENIGSHIIRRCDIHDCEQAGIVGHLGGAFSIIEENHIYKINTKHQLEGAEIGGIKLHAAIDTIIRNNHIDHCTRGIWLDWQAQGTRVTRNLFHDNMPPIGTQLRTRLAFGEDLFIEVSHGPTLVDNNIFLSVISGRLATQGVAYVHNLICGPFTCVGAGTDNGPNTQERYTPYHVPHSTLIAGFMTILHGDDRFYNNIFVQREIDEYYQHAGNGAKLSRLNLITGTEPFNDCPDEKDFLLQFSDNSDADDREMRSKYYNKLPVWFGGNLYCNGAAAADKEADSSEIKNACIKIELLEKDEKIYMKTNLYQYINNIHTDLISTATLGQAFEPEEKFENPDGTEIIFDQDFKGDKRSFNTMPGPIDNLTELNEIQLA